jgi:hypothetical protein
VKHHENYIGLFGRGSDASQQRRKIPSLRYCGLEGLSKRSARPDAHLDAALDRHVTACACHQHALHRPASPSLVQAHPDRTAYFERPSYVWHRARVVES